MKTPSFFQRSELAAVFWGLRGEFAVCMLFTVVVNVLMLNPTLYMLQVFDRVMVSQSELTLTALTLVMLFLFAVMSFSEWVRTRLLVRLGVKLDEQLNSRIFEATFESHLSQLGRNPAQTLSDLTNVRQFVTGQGLFAFMDLPWTPIYILVLFMLHPWLGFIGIFFSLILAGMAWLSHRMTHASVEVSMEAETHVNAYIHSKLKNAEVIESMGMLGDLRRMWQVRHQRSLVAAWNAGDIGSRAQSLTKFVSYAQQSLVLGAGALLVIRGELSPGAMIASNVLVGRATQPLSMMVSTWKAFLGAKAAFLRVEDLLRKYPARDGRLALTEPRGDMRIENLVATAPAREQPILKGLSADFPAGEVIGIVGPSGSGKSTLARALVGIWPYKEGKVLLDGEPIELWDREDLGPHLGYLPQDIELFEGTVAENVARFGEVNSEKVIAACQRAGIHEMILRFPKGYDTPMGEAGGFLSGGQRQRIGLARAMYGDPNVIVLDEPNSNLDDAGEAGLVRAVQDLKAQGCTVFLITHRMNVLGVTDRMLVMSDGTIAHYGLRQEVMAALLAKGQPAPQPGPAGGAVAQPA